MVTSFPSVNSNKFLCRLTEYIIIIVNCNLLVSPINIVYVALGRFIRKHLNHSCVLGLPEVQVSTDYVRCSNCHTEPYCITYFWDIPLTLTLWFFGFGQRTPTGNNSKNCLLTLDMSPSIVFL